MCTSIVLRTMDHKNLLSRTMDFAFDLDARPTICPRNYQWISGVDELSYTGKYAFVGAGKDVEHLLFADGVNEHGLSCAALYLPGEAVYGPVAKPNKVNLAPHDFLLWILSNCKSIADLQKKLGTINLVDVEVPLLGITTPLHWIMTDSTGQCMVIEPRDSLLKMQENPVSVLTNTPKLEWHISNLRNYIGIKPEPFTSKMFGEFEAKPFSQASGTSILPGGYTPPERFVRVAYLKEYIKKSKNEEEAITNIWHILNSVCIPNGVVIQENGSPDYTQYVASMCSESQTYYFSTCKNNQINSVKLTKELISTLTEPKTFDIKENQKFNSLN
ncbi:choloylglycine hydrolase family protein [Carnobacterium maltaromaticum]|uniref:choloylglycine hydrolase family protein n=1 Tax=Carnobacterium maltaromaticum TaxID=2751 RepID=UPI0028E31B47|nr:choloylglycine hydrolase family protein [Carnobacterium maltaromaticum]